MGGIESPLDESAICVAKPPDSGAGIRLDPQFLERGVLPVQGGGVRFGAESED